MSSSRQRSETAHPFAVRVHVHRHPDATSWESRITVYNGWDDIEAQNYGEVALSLPTGIYPVRVERGGEMFEEVIRHRGTTERLLEEPLRSSAVPSFDTTTSHEYYAYTSMDWSRMNTRDAAALMAAGPNAPRLFIFVRAESQEAYRGEDLSAGLTLHRFDGTLITSFEEEVTERDNDNGWLAFSAPVVPACYLLRQALPPAREMPIHVFEGWDSQLFLQFQDHALLETASFFFAAEGSGFDPEDRLTQAMDAALNGLRNGMSVLPQELQQMALSGKFDNPMLGLIGAHSLLMRPAPNPATVDIVLGNLKNLLPVSPDVGALEVLAAERLGLSQAGGSIASPPIPMLRLGLEAVIRASAKNPSLLPLDDFIDYISTSVYVDSPWTSWEPAGLVSRKVGVVKWFNSSRGHGFIQPNDGSEHAFVHISAVERAGLHTLREGEYVEYEPFVGKDGRSVAENVVLVGTEARGFRPEASRAAPSAKRWIAVPDWVRTLIRDESDRAGRRGKPLDLNALALDAGLPLRTLQRAAQAMGGLEPPRREGDADLEE